MPGWEYKDVRSVADLNPSVVAWGEDAVWGMEARAKNAEKYRQMGVKLIAANVWMLTATKEKLAQSEALLNASCRDIVGDRIVPAWLTGELKGVKDYWGCTNQPVFREQLRERVRNGMLAGANMLHLDDHMGTAAAAEHGGGCFCDACMVGFRDWLKTHVSKTELKQWGISEVSQFNYRTFLIERGVSSRAIYDARVKGLPMRNLFLRFQRQAVADFVQELKLLAEQTLGQPAPLGINAWNLSPTHLSNAHLADYFSNEMKHYGVEAIEPPFNYKLADALAKPVFSTATGDGWTKVNIGGETERVRTWLAMSYAFGHHFMYAFRQWAFNPETGTNWYEPAVSVYQPITDFVSSHRDLLDGYRPAATVGVVYSNAAQREGDPRLSQLISRLHQQSVQFKILAVGDEYLQHRIQVSDAEGLDFICTLPGQTVTSDQQRVLEAWTKVGMAGTCSDERINKFHRISVSLDPADNSANIWALQRVGNNKQSVIHLLNLHLNEKTGAPIPAQRITLAIPKELTGGFTSAEVYSPGKETRLIKPSARGAGQQVLELPTLERWAVVRLIR